MSKLTSSATIVAALCCSFGFATVGYAASGQPAGAVQVIRVSGAPSSRAVSVPRLSAPTPAQVGHRPFAGTSAGHWQQQQHSPSLRHPRSGGNFGGARFIAVPQTLGAPGPLAGTRHFAVAPSGRLNAHFGIGYGSFGYRGYSYGHRNVGRYPYFYRFGSGYGAALLTNGYFADYSDDGRCASLLRRYMATAEAKWLKRYEQCRRGDYAVRTTLY